LNLWTDERSLPIPLFAALTKRYGHDWLDWVPDVLSQTVEQDFRTTISKRNIVKALSAAAVASQDEFWNSWEHFHFLVQGLNFGVATTEHMQEHSVGEMMVAVDDAMWLRHKVASVVPVPEFSDALARYVAAQALAGGVWWLPEPLAFASDHASGKWYRCKDCGNESEVLFNDGLCDSCVHRFNTDQLGAFRPDPALVARGVGKNIEFFWKWGDPVPVRERFEKLRKVEDPVLEENRVDVCVARLLDGLHLVEARRQAGDDALKEAA
jgi:hypothetical protein